MITATVNGYSTVGTKATFAVSIEDLHGNSHERVVALETKSAYLAELAAIKYVLMTVKNASEHDITVKTSVKHIPATFAKEDGKWKKRQRTNKELVESIRDLSDEFKSFTCVLGDEEEMAKVKEEARSLP